MKALVAKIVFELPKVESHRGSVCPQVLVRQVVPVGEKLLMHGPEHSLPGGGLTGHSGTDRVDRTLTEGKMPKCVLEGNGLTAVLHAEGVPNLLHSPIDAAACGAGVVAVLHHSHRGIVRPERVVSRLDGWVQTNGVVVLHQRSACGVTEEPLRPGQFQLAFL